MDYQYQYQLGDNFFDSQTGQRLIVKGYQTPDSILNPEIKETKYVLESLEGDIKIQTADHVSSRFNKTDNIVSDKVLQDWRLGLSDLDQKLRMFNDPNVRAKLTKENEEVMLREIQKQYKTVMEQRKHLATILPEEELSSIELGQRIQDGLERVEAHHPGTFGDADNSAPKVNPEKAPEVEVPKSGDVPEIEANSRSGGSTRPENEPRKEKSPDGPSHSPAPPNKNTTAVDKAKAKKFGKLGLFSLALNAGIGASSYVSSRNEGDGIVASAVKATAETAVSSVMGPGKYLAGLALIKAPGFIAEQYESLSQQARAMERTGSQGPFIGNTFVDNAQIFTMRQASVAMMQQSKYNLEHAMQGSEASFLHR